MKLLHDCMPCLLRQALDAGRLASDDPEVHGRVLETALQALVQIEDYPTSPDLAGAIHAAAREASGSDDPFAEHKQQDIADSLKLEPLLWESLPSGPERLSRALKIAATGNVLDAGIAVDIDIAEVLHTELERPFAVFDVEELARDLQSARTVLVIGDNSGEVVFDKVLVTVLGEQADVTYAVRGAPIINDATLVEAEAAGMTKLATVMSSGSRLPGTVLQSTSPEFRQVFDAADVVIAKGMGNYEGLNDAPRRMFFLLKAKCIPVATDAGVGLGDYVFAVHEPGRADQA